MISFSAQEPKDVEVLFFAYSGHGNVVEHYEPAWLIGHYANHPVVQYKKDGQYEVLENSGRLKD